MISVIIPASKDYQDKYLKDCLSSVTPNCEVVVETWDKSSEKWTDSINRAINKAKGEYVIVLGIDDKLTEGIIEKLEKEIDGETDVYFGQLKMFGNSDLLMIPNKNPSIEDFMVNNQVYVTNLVRKQAILDIGGYYSEEGPYYEDWDLWFRLKLANKKFKYVDYPIFYYRDHDGQAYKQMIKDYDNLKNKVLKHCLNK